jgi:hypothetical protein
MPFHTRLPHKNPTKCFLTKEASIFHIFFKETVHFPVQVTANMRATLGKRRRLPYWQSLCFQEKILFLILIKVEFIDTKSEDRARLHNRLFCHRS